MRLLYDPVATTWLTAVAVDMWNKLGNGEGLDRKHGPKLPNAKSAWSMEYYEEPLNPLTRKVIIEIYCVV